MKESASKSEVLAPGALAHSICARRERNARNVNNSDFCPKMKNWIWRGGRLTRPRARTPVSPSQDLPEGLYRRRLIILHVKNGVKLRDLQQVMNFLGQLEQLQFATLVFRCGICADQFTNARAVNVIHVAKVQQNLFVALAEQVLYGIAKHYAAFAEGYTSAAIDNAHTIHLARADFQIHWEASLPPSVMPWTCLISLISVPVLDG